MPCESRFGPLGAILDWLAVTSCFERMCSVFLARELELPINRTPDKSNFFLFPLKVRIIESRLYIESDLKGNGNCFELAGGSSYRDSTVFTLYSLLFFSPFLKNIQEVEW